MLVDIPGSAVLTIVSIIDALVDCHLLPRQTERTNVGKPSVRQVPQPEEIRDPEVRFDLPTYAAMVTRAVQLQQQVACLWNKGQERKLGLINKKTVRGVRGGRKVRACRLAHSRSDLVQVLAPSSGTSEPPGLAASVESLSLGLRLCPCHSSCSSASVLDGPFTTVLVNDDNPVPIDISLISCDTSVPAVPPPSSPTPAFPFQFTDLSPPCSSIVNEDGSSVDPLTSETLDITSSSESQIVQTQLLCGLLNAQSVVRKAVDIHNMIIDKSLDLLLLTETWLREAGDELVIKQITPVGYSFIHNPSMSRPGLPRKTVYTRNVRGMDSDSFRTALQRSALLVSPPDNVDELVALYNSTLSALLDKFAPVKKRCITERPDTAWFTPEVRRAKKVRRQAERKWRKSRLEVDRQIYRHTWSQCSAIIVKARSRYVMNIVSSAVSDSRKMFAVVNGLLGKDVTQPVLPEMDDLTAASTLSAYFEDKIKTIMDSFSDSTLGKEKLTPKTDVLGHRALNGSTTH
ncbi:hypothetical protein C0Q70_14823 [Pomacea canaliculata]|uniref:Uncharacterized protein n=1 Tax=Pomacea canaliculata TaxID=400727 RepID=A0A2T7NT47_POMCA|nr:hypothetical protein C0Q70_14823 [Pomacea canaliculata]